MAKTSDLPRVSFLEFFLIWAALRGWEVPLIHYVICDWLERCEDRVRVLLVWRGASKSTIFACYKAWRLYINPSFRSQIWAADDDVASKLTRDTINVLRRHPLCAGMITGKPGAMQFWVKGSTDARNPSMAAIGINSNATSSRADAADFDDIEVPKNCKTPEARAQLRERAGESTHILVPGGQKTYIGTPHTYDSMYEEQIKAGAAILKIPLYLHAARFEDTTKRMAFAIPFEPEADGVLVLASIGKHSRLLEPDFDYRLEGRVIVFARPPGITFDVLSGNQWPEHFTTEEVVFRRKECATFGEWDSQYMLANKPATETRLDPNKLVPYDAEPTLHVANGEASLILGKARIVGASAWWDPAAGKLNGNVSALAVVMQDDRGRRYWHRAAGLMGGLVEFGPDGSTIVSGQVMQIADIVQELHLPKVTVETNGIGQFAPTALKACLRQRRIQCAVVEELASAQKEKRILGAFEGPLSSGMLWAHVSVIRGPARPQLQEFDPRARDQEDDHIDAASGAITDTPERIRYRPPQGEDELRPLHAAEWQPSAAEITLNKPWDA